MKMEDYYTKDEIDYICMYYGQIPENLTYNMKILFFMHFIQNILKCYSLDTKTISFFFISALAYR